MPELSYDNIYESCFDMLKLMDMNVHLPQIVFPLALVWYAAPLFGQVSITTPALPNPIVGKAVSGAVWTLSASGGTTPYTWNVSAGSLPAGLSLLSGGTITGTATTTGASTFTLRVTDAASATATHQFTIIAQQAIGRGCTTATIIDWDCDYYGVGSAVGMDADDNDATVNTVASWRTKYGSGPTDTSLATFRAYLTAVKGYNPINIWFLSTTGNDSTCAANDISLPCATWITAYSKMSAGDALVARGGTWTKPGATDISYYMGRTGTTALHPEIIMGYPGESPIFDHEVAGNYGIGPAFTGGMSYIILDGLTVQNSPCAVTCSGAGMGINFNGPGGPRSIMYGFVLRNSMVRYWARDVWNTQASYGMTIENNILTESRGEHNIYLAWNTDGDPSGIVNPIVRYNILSNASWDNFHGNGKITGLLLEGNIIYSSATGAGPGPPAIQFQGGVNHSTVSNNVVMFGASVALSINNYFDGNTTILSYDQNYNSVINNTFIRSGRSSNGNDMSTDSNCAVQVNNSDPTTTPDLGHNTYQNNIILEAAVNDWNPTSSYGCVVRYGQQTSSDLAWWTTDTYMNNVIYGMYRASPLSIGIQGGFNGDYGPWVRNWSQFSTLAGTFTNNLNVNPLLTAYDPSWYATPERYNLAPQSGSPAIGAGLQTGAPATDIRGNPRANPPDIGAYQYSGVISPPVSGSYCDLNGDGLVNAADVTSAINQVLGLAPCTNGDLRGTGSCDSVDVQRVISAALGGTCRYH